MENGGSEGSAENGEWQGESLSTEQGDDGLRLEF